MKTNNNVRSLIGLILITFSSLLKAGQIELNNSLDALKNHLNNSSVLSGTQLLAHASTIDNNSTFFSGNFNSITSAFNLISQYDGSIGPLFVNAVKDGFTKGNYIGVEIHWAMYRVQQGLMDYAYASDVLLSNPSIFNGKKFGSSSYFPGAVSAPTDPNSIYTVDVNATNAKAWGRPVMFESDLTRRPTGAYVAPGSIVEITVPAKLVGKGFSIRVGAHSVDHEKEGFVGKYKRMTRSTILFPVNSQTIKVSSPIGGAIYLEVPYLASEGISTLSFKNCVRSPFFSYKDFYKMDNQDWINNQVNNSAPWADFESEQFLFQVPSNWIRSLNDPVSLMMTWDSMFYECSKIMGYPVNRGKTVAYTQVDVVMRGWNSHYPGYPMANYTYNPINIGSTGNFLINGPRNAGYDCAVMFHELGHAHLFSKFTGEVEAIVNLPFVPISNIILKTSLDSSFGRSTRFDQEHIGLDQAAISWMVTSNFRAGNNMKDFDEIGYQHRGYGKYIEIASLFGWKAIQDFFYQQNLNYNTTNGAYNPGNSQNTDERILELSRKAGVDLRPLIHFWGKMPINQTTLKSNLTSENLLPSVDIYNRLVYYLSIIPKNRQEFQDHAFFFEKQNLNGLSTTNPYYQRDQYITYWNSYDESWAQQSRTKLTDIINLYFPNGKPNNQTNCLNTNLKVDLGSNLTSCKKDGYSGLAETTINSTVSGGKAPYDYQWNHNLGNNSSITIVPKEFVVYSIQVTDADGCVSGDEMYIKNDPNAFLDNCNVCVGGTTGKTACNIDCAGDTNGTATYDNCGVCSGGTTGKVANANCPSYCIGMGSTQTGINYINKVTYGNIEKISGKDRYSNYTYLSSDVVPCDSFLLKFYMNYHYGSETGYSWIDWNRDGVFGSEELIRMSILDANHSSYAMVKVPENALGKYRIRVRAQGISPGPDPCSTTINGEVEDYTFNVLDDNSVCLGCPAGSISCIKDCNNDPGGTAYLDNCDLCVGGNTGKTDCNVTSIEDIESLVNLSIHPNPSTGILHLELNPLDDFILSISDANGRIIYINKIDGQKEAFIDSINIQGEPSGVYYIKLMSEEINLFKKIILLE